MKKISSLQRKAEQAMKSAIRDVVNRHKNSGRPLSIWQDGKVALVSPNKIH